MTRLAICAVALVACIIFSVLLLTGTFDGKTSGSQPASGDTISSCSRGEALTIPPPTAYRREPPARCPPRPPLSHPEPTPEPTPVPTTEGLERAAHHLL